MNKFLTLTVIMFLSSGFLKSQEIVRSSEYQLIWADEFNYTGIPDERYWSHEIMRLPPNDELEYYVNSRKNSFVEDGMLKIRAIKEVLDGRNYTSARITSRNKVDWKYGRVEIRAKLPSGKGTWPAIWMMYTNDIYGGWPASGEIDIMEHVGHDPNNVHATIHTKAFNHTLGTQIGKAYYLPDSEKAFHVYSCEWNEDSVKVFVDNVHYFTFKNDKKGNFETWPYNHDFYLILNIAIGGGWGGAVDNTIFKNDSSVQMLIDYVRLYKKAADYKISGPAAITEDQQASFSVAKITDGHTFEWVLPQGVEALTRTDSAGIKLKWSCKSDTLKIKVRGTADSATNYLVVQVKEPQIKGKIWVPENAVNIKYSIDSLPGASFKWTADNGISFPAGDNSSKVSVNFAAEGNLYTEVTTSCGVKYDTLQVRFGTGQFPYPDAQKPHTIPGRIIAAHFDAGGPGIAYKDLDAENKGKAIRNDEQVDIESFDNSYTVGWFDNGEWMKYTVEVAETKAYSATFRVASGAASGGKFDILLNDSLIVTGMVKSTGGWNTFANMTINDLIIPEGKHVLQIKSYGGFNLGNMTFSVQTIVDNANNDEVKIFPNPASETIRITSNDLNARLQITGMDGRIYLDSIIGFSKELDVKNWPRGIYTARVYIQNSSYTQKVILR